MKKYFTLILLVLMFCPFNAFGQNFEAIRQYVSDVPKQYDNNPRALAQYLAKPCSTDLQKAMVIFAWISLNVEYDYYKYTKLMGNDRIPKIGNVWNTRVGVCLDIAELYQELLSYVNVRSDVVLGYAGDGMNRGNYKDNGHAWNVVYTDGKSILVDSTWGIEGAIGRNYKNNMDYKLQSFNRKNDKTAREQKLKRNIGYSWFDVAPDKMIRTHYPRDSKNQLLPAPYNLNKFLSQNVGIKF